MLWSMLTLGYLLGEKIKYVSQNEKRIKTMWVFIFQKYANFEAFH